MSYCRGAEWYIWGDNEGRLSAVRRGFGVASVTLADCRRDPAAAAASLREQSGLAPDLGSEDDVSEAVAEHVAEWRDAGGCDK